jgi:hypothetical protein
MDNLYRRLGGLALALIMVPVFIGLLACMPVPVGDPERSKIDPARTGVWIGAVDDGPMILIYEPYDKRTWLMRNYQIGGSYEKSSIELTYADAVAGLDLDGEDPEDFELYKVWRTKIGKRWFETWEPRCDEGDCNGLPENISRDEGEFWFVWLVEQLDANRTRMYMVNGDSDVFDDIEDFELAEDRANLFKLRRAAEKVIRRNLDDPEMYMYYEDDESFVMFRMTPEDYEKL